MAKTNPKNEQQPEETAFILWFSLIIIHIIVEIPFHVVAVMKTVQIMGYSGKKSKQGTGGWRRGISKGKKGLCENSRVS